eukprot:scaffold56_cov379-Prasinococcus_capsulatus_cf.AAC.7
MVEAAAIFPFTGWSDGLFLTGVGLPAGSGSTTASLSWGLCGEDSAPVISTARLAEATELAVTPGRSDASAISVTSPKPPSLGAMGTPSAVGSSASG